MNTKIDRSNLTKIGCLHLFYGGYFQNLRNQKIARNDTAKYACKTQHAKL